MENKHINNPNNSNTHLQNGHHVNTHVKTVNPDSVSYEDGYIHGRAAERSSEKQDQEVRDEHSAARGLLVGIGLASIVGFVGGTLFYLNQRQEAPTPTQVIVPVPRTFQQPNRETTIIERTTEKTQQSAPTTQASPTAPQQSQPDIKLPDIRVIVPNSGQQAPSKQNTTPSTTSQSAPTQTQNPSVTNSPSPGPNTSTSTSTTRQPSTNNQTSENLPETQIPTVRTTTESPNTTNQSSSEQTQNQTQRDTSGSVE